MSKELLYLLLAGLSVLIVVSIIFLGLRSKRRVEDVQPPTAEVEDTVLVEPAHATEAPVEELLEPPPVVEPPLVEVAPPKISVAQRFSRGLQRSRQLLSERLGQVLGKEKLTDEDWDDIEEALIRADVGVKTATKIVNRLRQSNPKPEELKSALRDQLLSVLTGKERRLHSGNGTATVWLVTGVNGVGKTTSIAKLAHLMKSEGRSVVLAAADTFRAAAIDQLGTWADRADAHMVRHEPGADPGAVVFDAISYAKARNVDLVIVDTAGRLHTKTNLMEELKKIKRVAERESGSVSEVLLVLDATVGQNGISQAKTFQSSIDVTGLVLTKLDGSAKGGIVVAVEEELGIPVKAVGIGETLDDLQPFDPEVFVEALLAD